MKYLNLGVTLLVFIIVGITFLFFSAAAILFVYAIVILSMSILVVPITWIFGLMTSQSYDRVCDNSEIVYQLNRFGKWAILFSIGVLVAWLVYKIIF
jgi:hypothetical protein